MQFNVDFEFDRKIEREYLKDEFDDPNDSDDYYRYNIWEDNVMRKYLCATYL